MSTKLNQILALEADAKRVAQTAMIQASSILGNDAALSGFTRSYEPLAEDGERLDTQRSIVQHSAPDVLDKLQLELVRLFDLTATKDWANTEARADVVVGDEVLLEKVPTTYLLFLEKQLTELEGFITRLPTLDQAEDWKRSEAQGLWATDPVKTIRAKKTPKVLVKYEPTKEHPAQTEVYYDDIPVGNWTLIKYSGALPVEHALVLLGRVRALKAAVKTAREEANTHPVTDQKVAEKILNHLFG